MLNEKHPEKVKYFLSKADDVSVSTDLQKVLVQITQNLASIVRNKSFDIQTVYLPSEDKKCSVPNGIYDLCKTIEKTINLTVQRSLDDLEKDCGRMVATIDRTVAENERKAAANSAARNKGLLFAALSFATFFFLLLLFGFGLVEDYFRNHPDSTVAAAGLVLSRVTRVTHSLSAQSEYFAWGLGALVVIFLLLSKFSWRQQPTLSRKERSTFAEHKKYISDTVLKIRKELYNEYLREVAHDQ